MLSTEVEELRNRVIDREPQTVNSQEFRMAPWVRHNYQRVRILVDENYNITWQPVEGD